MRTIKNLGYFEREQLISDIARKLAKEQGYEITCSDLNTSDNYKIKSYISLAQVALSEVESFLR